MRRVLNHTQPRTHSPLYCSSAAALAGSAPPVCAAPITISSSASTRATYDPPRATGSFQNRSRAEIRPGSALDHGASAAAHCGGGGMDVEQTAAVGGVGEGCGGRGGLSDGIGVGRGS